MTSSEVSETAFESKVNEEVMDRETGRGRSVGELYVWIHIDCLIDE